MKPTSRPSPFLAPALVFVLAILPLVPGTSLGQDPEAPPTPEQAAEKFGPEARSAFLRWRKARHEADRGYLAELKTCLEKATGKGDLAEANLIQAEIRRLETRLNPFREDSLAQFLVDTTWVNSANGATITLKADGKGVRSQKGNDSRVTWEVVSESSFKIQWPSAPASLCELAEDRRSFQGGETPWLLKP